MRDGTNAEFHSLSITVDLLIARLKFCKTDVLVEGRLPFTGSMNKQLYSKRLSP